MKIDRTEIVRHALILLKEVGLDKLSTRALALKLGVQQPALYWHFRNKRELMDAMNAEMMRNSHRHRLPDEGDDWRSFLLENTRSFRMALLEYRDGARVHAGSRAEASDRATAEGQLRFLVDQGFDVRTALRTLVTLSRFTIGFVLEEQAELEHPPVIPDEEQNGQSLLIEAFRDYRQSSMDELFDEGLSAIVNGLAMNRLPTG